MHGRVDLLCHGEQCFFAGIIVHGQAIEQAGATEELPSPIIPEEAVTVEMTEVSEENLTEESAALNGNAFDENGQIKDRIYFDD